MPDFTPQDHERARQLCIVSADHAHVGPDNVGLAMCRCDQIATALAGQRERDAQIAAGWRPSRNPDGGMSMARDQIALAIRKGD